jgi:adenosylhomocysteine nucleosidase
VTDSSASRQSSDTEGESPSDRTTADFGLVCSHRSEIRGLLPHIDRVRKYVDNGLTFRGGFMNQSVRVALVEAGNGFARHRRAAEALVREHRPKWVLSVGFGSALDQSIRAGSLVLANRIKDTHKNDLEVPCRIPSSNRIHVGLCVVADSHPSTVAQKQELARLSGAIAVDTVSLAVAQVCDSNDVRFLSICGVIDAAAEEMPELACQLLFRPTSKAWGGAVGGVVRSFRNASVLNEWRKRSVETSDNIGTFTSSVITRIADKLNL